MERKSDASEAAVQENVAIFPKKRNSKTTVISSDVENPTDSTAEIELADISFQATPDGALPDYSRPDVEKALQFQKKCRPARIPDPNQGTKFRLAQIGEISVEPGKEPERYKLFDHLRVLDEFGLGISMYFRQLAVLSFFMIICALIMLASITYNEKFNPSNIGVNLKGTAQGVPRNELHFAKQVAPDIAITVILFAFGMLSIKAEEHAVEHIDVNQQTATDYSVKIHNPLPDIYDPDVYYQHFNAQFQVDIVFITISLNNGELLQALANREKMRSNLRTLRSFHVMQRIHNEWVPEQDKLNCFQRLLQPLGLYQTVEYLELQLTKLEKKIDDLSKCKYEPETVYITFDTEEDQREFLAKYSFGILERFFRRCYKGNKDNIFQGTRLLASEPFEPSDIIWEHEHIHMWRRNTRNFQLLLVNGAFMVAFYYLIKAAEQVGAVSASIVISIVNNILPMIALNTTIYEYHKTRVDEQASIVIKMALARMLVTAVFLYLVTKFEERTSEHFIQKIQGILITDCVVTPILNVSNLVDWAKRKLLIQSAKTQTELDLLFQGADWNLAERYTSLIKTCFVGMFYLAILPSALFVTSAAILATFLADKYCLFNTWRRPPSYNEKLATISRQFLLIVIWVHCYMTRIFFANWPYENAADAVDCDFLTCSSSKWTNDQRLAVYAYTILHLIIFFTGVSYYGFNIFSLCVCCCPKKEPEFRGDATTHKYRDILGAQCYVPLVQLRTCIDPFIFFASDTNIPLKYYPLRQDIKESYKDFVLTTRKTLPSIEEDKLLKLFAKVKYYGASLNAPGSYQLPPTNQKTSANLDVFKTAVLATKVFQASQMSIRRPSLGVRSASSLGVRHAPSAQLPEGWEERFTDDNRPYYVNHETRTTQWDRPVIEIEEDSEDSLPPGWEMRKTEDDRVYYVDHNTKTSHWELPSWDRNELNQYCRQVLERPTEQEEVRA